MTTKTANPRPALLRRIRSFYDMLNERKFEQCHKMIDPRILASSGSVTLFQYENALQQFGDRFGLLNVQEIELTLHLDEPSKLYEGRDFAVGKAIVLDGSGQCHVFLERWVREGRSWYTRSTGFVTPASSFE